MKIALLLFCALLTTTAAHAKETYGELAKSKIAAAAQEMDKAMQVLGPDVAPEETKDLRKKIVALREQLDLFVYAYPKKNPDLWLEIRTSLDKGYEVIGAFKDLSDAQLDPNNPEIDQQELSELRKEVLDWQSDWSRSQRTYSRYYSQPDPQDFYSRDKSKLSKFYWGASKIEPSDQYSGLENLALLCADLANESKDTWKEVKELKDLDKKSQEETFHDLRKRLRSLVRVIRNFPEIYRGPDAALTQIDGLVEKYGIIHDKMMALERNRKKEKRAKALKKEIRSIWSDLLDEQKSIGMVDLLEEIEKGVAN